VIRKRRVSAKDDDSTIVNMSATKNQITMDFIVIWFSVALTCSVVNVGRATTGYENVGLL
jgi:hypothetical protein